MDGPEQATDDFETPEFSGTVAFGDLEKVLGFHLRLANVAVFQDFQATMSGLALTPKQFAVLELIDNNAGASQIDFAQSLRMDKATMMALINKLEGRGAVERRPSQVDRRRQELFVTEEGQRVLAAAKELRHGHEARFTERFSKDELAQLLSFLRRIYQDGRALPKPSTTPQT
ncbi:MarR family winged helix-turn-helix transcriptional regulator [Agrobacterium vitis]|uniref:MarR family winged helix-turn-helix transcriptional regulator n=1 Tax=Agrobacterium vitis TaxID=373 RepID=UPI0012E98BBD|nr:MarR family transcriptional regulator [Agrobacterium vitis]MVA25254.1 MarR family transcriptional regulator [Agrobacterium vitis]